jgi:hypothetical protein
MRKRSLNVDYDQFMAVLHDPLANFGGLLHGLVCSGDATGGAGSRLRLARTGRRVTP